MVPISRFAFPQLAPRFDGRHLPALGSGSQLLPDGSEVSRAAHRQAFAPLALSLELLPLDRLFDLLAASLLQVLHAADTLQFHQPRVIDDPVARLGVLNLHITALQPLFRVRDDTARTMFKSI